MNIRVWKSLSRVVNLITYGVIPSEVFKLTKKTLLLKGKFALNIVPYQMNAVLISTIIAGLPRAPVGVGGLGEGVLPDIPALLGGVTQSNPVELALSQEAEQGSLVFLKFIFEIWNCMDFL